MKNRSLGLAAIVLAGAAAIGCGGAPSRTLTTDDISAKLPEARILDRQDLNSKRSLLDYVTSDGNLCTGIVSTTPGGINLTQDCYLPGVKITEEVANKNFKYFFKTADGGYVAVSNLKTENDETVYFVFDKESKLQKTFVGKEERPVNASLAQKSAVRYKQVNQVYGGGATNAVARYAANGVLKFEAGGVYLASTPSSK